MSRSILGAGFLTLWLALAGLAAEKHFLIRIQPVRATFNQDATPEENKVMGKHFAYLQKLLKEGKLVLAGPAEPEGRRPFGLIIVEAASMEEATSIMKGDPSVKANIMTGEIFPFSLALLKGRD